MTPAEFRALKLQAGQRISCNEINAALEAAAVQAERIEKALAVIERWLEYDVILRSHRDEIEFTLRGDPS